MQDIANTNMRNLYRRGKKGMLYMKFAYLGCEVNKCTKTTDPDLAQEAIKQLKKDLYLQKLKGGDIPKKLKGSNKPNRTSSSSITFSQAIEDVYKERWVGNVSGTTSYRYARAVLNIVGDIPIVEIDTKKVRIAHAHLKGTISNVSTVNRYLTAFRTVIRHAAESYALPVPKFPQIKDQDGRIKVFTRQEENAIINWFRSHEMEEMADISVLLIDTGFRLSECLGIGRRGKDGRLISEANIPSRRVTSWVNKGAKPRTVPLTQRASQILEVRGRVPFTITKDKYERNWKKMRDALGLERDCVAHAYRHTCASRLLETGSSLLVVKEWLGHSSIEVTMKYCHLASTSLDEAAKRLELFS
ncbi:MULTISPECIES: tyrosine-type recombinase/integrase [Geomonas]|uniref:tyrosine-type recombinase/integrase n=1 Tax=Geomonas TaxID=2651583 RepID=UPI0013A5BE3D|nr:MULTISPECIES: site-specific integrase [Geomonas]